MPILSSLYVPQSSLYLSQAIRGNYQNTAFNVIEAPCGCGKSFYAVEYLPKQILGDTPQYNKILYLIDTCAGRHGIVYKYNDLARCYDDFLDSGVPVAFGDRIAETNKIVVMTYAKFGVLCRYHPDFINRFSIAIADEFHNLYWPIAVERGKIRNYYSNEPASKQNALLEARCNNLLAVRSLKRAAQNPNILTVGLSATPGGSDKWPEWEDMPRYKVPLAPNIKHYTERDTIRYSSLDTLLQTLPSGEKTLIYVDHITEIKRYMEVCRAVGLSCAGVWSENNEKHPMTEEQISMRRAIIETGDFPSSVDVLFINKSMETSINIYTPVPRVVVHATGKDTQIQARGRIRSDIDTLYLLQHDARYLDLENLAAKGYFDRPLSQEDKRAFCEATGLKDCQGHALKWNTLKKTLIDEGCQIRQKRIGTKNFDIVSRPDRDSEAE